MNLQATETKGDRISCLVMFSCSIRSNSKNPYLEWELTLPDTNRPVGVLYNSEATLDIDVAKNLDRVGIVTLTNYTNPEEVNSRVLNGYIESTLTLTLLPVIDVSRIMVKCATDIRYKMTPVFNASGM